MANGNNDTTTVANFDVATLAGYCVSFAKELIKSQSARQRDFIDADRNRALSYLDRIAEYAELTADTKLDLPQSHPDAYPVPAFPPDGDIDSLENEIVKGVLRRFKASYREIRDSQSRDAAAGLHNADKGRIDALIEATRNLVNFGKATLDTPEQTGPNVSKR